MGQISIAVDISKISQLKVSDQTFELDASITEKIQNENDIWFSKAKFSVIVRVSEEISYFFTRRKLLPDQEVIETLKDGGLRIQCTASHLNQILPLIQYWIPNIEIESPASLKEELENRLRGYISRES